MSVTGLLGGLALLTNEITFCLVAVPLLFAILQRDWPLIRRSAAALAISFASRCRSWPGRPRSAWPAPS